MSQTIDQQIEQLREAYRTANDDRRAEITQIARELNSRRCYQCREYPHTEEHLPFCSQECHEAWSGDNHKPAGENKTTIEQAVAGLRRMAQKERAKKYPQSTIGEPAKPSNRTTDMVHG